MIKKQRPHPWSFMVALLLLGGVSTFVWARYEKEQVMLENQLTDRIEGILAKTLPPNSYLVTVKVEMEEGTRGGVNRTVNTRGGENPFMQKNRFVLPGVPEKKQFSTTPEVTQESTVVNPPAEALIKKITITILVSPDVNGEQIRSLREFISSAIPFNPLRGDELDIQTSPLLKSSKSQTSGANAGGVGVGTNTSNDKSWLGEGVNMPLFIVLIFVAVGLIGLTAFLFGPVRGFFNRLLAVLPRVGEQAIYAANASGNGGGAAASAAHTPQAGYPGAIHGMQQNDNTPKLNMPFQFIREEQLSKLPMLFRELSSTEIALILAYLPPAWSSRLIAGFDAATQGAVMRELSKSREVPAEVVNQVEAQIKEKLPYMVGGAEWVQQIFPLTPPQTQKVLLNTLSQESPDVAKALRLKTFFFEDLGNLSAPALRVLVQDLGYPQLALAMKDEKKEMQEMVMRKLPAGIRTIVQQELELSSGDKRAINDAKNRLVVEVRRLAADGRIALGEQQKSA
jgi:hypothetical protein